MSVHTKNIKFSRIYFGHVYFCGRIKKAMDRKSCVFDREISNVH